MQFDVYPTPGQAKAFFPYVVDVQADLLSSLDTRLIVPLLPMQTGKAAPKALTRLNPVVELAGKRYVLLANQIANISASRLRQAVGNIADQRQAIIEAIDFLVTGI